MTAALIIVCLCLLVAVLGLTAMLMRFWQQVAVHHERLTKALVARDLADKPGSVAAVAAALTDTPRPPAKPPVIPIGADGNP